MVQLFNALMFQISARSYKYKDMARKYVEAQFYGFEHATKGCVILDLSNRGWDHDGF